MPAFAAIVVLGSLLALYGNDLPDRLWSAYVPMLLLFAGCNPAWRRPLLLAAAYLWAAALMHYHLDHRLPAAFDNRSARVSGTVADLPQIGNGRVRFYLDDVEFGNGSARPPRRLRLNWYQQRILPRAGERWQFDVKLRRPRGLSNPGAFDFGAWQFVHGIDGVGYIHQSPANRRLSASSRWQLAYWRTRLAQAIDDYCAGCAHRGLIKALALGYRGDIGERDASLLRGSGTAHLLAISGMHIGLVAGMAFALARIAWRAGWRGGARCRLDGATLWALLAATVYAALAGFGLPTVRALIMLAVLGAAILLRRRIDLLHSLSLAVVVILLADPRAVGSASFWLSAGAVLVIAYARLRLSPRQRWWQQLLLLQLYFTLLFAPIGAFVFGFFNPAGLPANLVAIPLVGFVVLPLTLLGSLCAAAGPVAAAPLLELADRLLHWLLEYLQWLSASGLDSVPSAFPPPLLACLLTLTAWLALPRGLGARPAATVAIALLLLWQPPRPRPGELELVVFDVGMGTSVLARTRNHSLVYDFGPGLADIYSAADWGLLPYLRRQGIERADLAVVSHVDQDHSGGLHRFLSPDSRPLLLSGTPLELRRRFHLEFTPRSCHDYPPWRWDGVDFRFLPGGEGWSGTNNRSCVLRIEASHRILLPGDIEHARERELLERQAADLRAEVLLVPHHGSDTSSSAAFIRQVAPRYAVATLSRGNRWGFPAAAVQRRYLDAGVELLRSDRDGAVTVHSGADGLRLAVQRGPPARIWRRW